MGRWFVLRVVAWGLRRGVPDDVIEQAMRSRLPHRGSMWRWDVIGDAHLLNDRKHVRRGYRAWRSKQDA